MKRYQVFMATLFCGICFANVLFAQESTAKESIAEKSTAEEPTVKELVGQAIKAYGANDPAAALSLIDQAIKKSATPDAVLHTWKCKILYDLNRVPDAMAEIDRALQISPEFAAAYRERALIELLEGNHEAALADYNKIFQGQSGMQPFEMRGYTHFELGNVTAALADFSSWIKERTAADDKDDLADAYATRGKWFEKLKSYDLAIEQYNASMKIVPSSKHVFSRARCLGKLGEYADAIKDINNFLANEQEPQAIHFYTRAGFYKFAGNLGKAKEDLDRAEKLLRQGANQSSDVTLEWIQRARESVMKLEVDLLAGKSVAQPGPRTFPVNQKHLDFLAELERLENGSEQWGELVDKMLDAPLEHADVAESKALLYGFAEQYDKALEVLEQGLEMEPANVHLLLARISLYKEKMKAGELTSVETFDKTNLDIDRLIFLGHPTGIQFRASFFHAVENYDRALTAFSDAIVKTKKEEAGELVHLRAKTLFAAKIHDVALAEFEKAVALGYDEPGSRITMAILHAGNEEHAKVIEDLSFEIEHGSTNPNVRFYRGFAFESLGQLDKAKQEYEKGLELSQVGTQPHEIATNSLRDLQFKLDTKRVLQTIHKGDTNDFKQQMNPALAKVIDDEKIADRFNLINHNFPNLDTAIWTGFELDPNLQQQQVTIRMGGGADQLVVYRDKSGKLMGVAIQKSDFQTDTLDVIADDLPYAETAANLWAAYFGNDVKELYDVMSTDWPADLLNSALPYEPFEEHVSNLLERTIGKSGMPVIGHSLLNARIMEPNLEQESFTIGCFHLLEFNGDKFNPGRVIFTHHPKVGKFLVTDYNTGEFAGTFTHRDFGFEQSFLNAIVSGDPKKVEDLLYPSDKSVIVAEILVAYQAGLREEYGNFKSVTPESSYNVVTFSNGVEKNKCQGVAIFEKGSIPFEILSSFGTLDEFNLESGIKGWAKKIKKHSKMEQHGQKFLQTLATGQIDEIHNLLPDGFDTVTEEGIKDFQASLNENIGNIESIDLTGKTFDEKGNQWKYDYVATGSKAKTTGYVIYKFSGWNATINRFNLNFVPTEESTTPTNDATKAVQDATKDRS